MGRVDDERDAVARLESLGVRLVRAPRGVHLNPQAARKCNLLVLRAQRHRRPGLCPGRLLKSLLGDRREGPAERGLGQAAEGLRERGATVFHRRLLDTPQRLVGSALVLVRRRLVRLQRGFQRVRAERGRGTEHLARVTRRVHHGGPSQRRGDYAVATRQTPDSLGAPARDAAAAETRGVGAPRRGPTLHHLHAHRVGNPVPLHVDPHRALNRGRVLDEHLHRGVRSNLARVAKVHLDVVAQDGLIRDVRRVTSHGDAVQTPQNLVLHAQPPRVGDELETQRFRRAVHVHRDQRFVPRARSQRREYKPHSLATAGRDLILAPIHVEVEGIAAFVTLTLGLGGPPEHRREHGHVLDHNLPLHGHVDVAHAEVDFRGTQRAQGLEDVGARGDDADPPAASRTHDVAPVRTGLGRDQCALNLNLGVRG